MCHSKKQSKGTVKIQRSKGDSWNPRNQLVKSSSGCGKVKRGKSQVSNKSGKSRPWMLDSMVIQCLGQNSLWHINRKQRCANSCFRLWKWLGGCWKAFLLGAGAFVCLLHLGPVRLGYTLRLNQAQQHLLVRYRQGIFEDWLANICTEL